MLWSIQRLDTRPESSFPPSLTEAKPGGDDESAKKPSDESLPFDRCSVYPHLRGTGRSLSLSTVAAVRRGAEPTPIADSTNRKGVTRTTGQRSENAKRDRTTPRSVDRAPHTPLLPEPGEKTYSAKRQFPEGIGYRIVCATECFALGAIEGTEPHGR